MGNFFKPTKANFELKQHVFFVDKKKLKIFEGYVYQCDMSPKGVFYDLISDIGNYVINVSSRSITYTDIDQECMHSVEQGAKKQLYNLFQSKINELENDKNEIDKKINDFKRQQHNIKDAFDDGIEKIKKIAS